MSRVACLVVISALLVPCSALAQSEQSAAPSVAASAKAVLPPDDDTAKNKPNLAERLLTSPRESRCDDTGEGGITVCGKKVDPTRNRLPLPEGQDSPRALNDGVPRAPDVMGNRIKGHSISLGCSLSACPPAMMPDIDFRLMPAAPDGSDADRIAKGEIRAN